MGKGKEVAYQAFFPHTLHMSSAGDAARAAFAEAFRKLQISNPSGRLTVKDIAALSGYDRHTFYYYFNGIHDLMEWVFDEEASAVLSQCGGNPDRAIDHIVDYIGSNRSLVLSLFHSSRYDEVNAFLTRRLSALISEYLSGSRDIPQASQSSFSVFIAAGFLGVLYSWIESGFERGGDSVAGDLHAIIGSCLKGLRG